MPMAPGESARPAQAYWALLPYMLLIFSRFNIKQQIIGKKVIPDHSLHSYSNPVSCAAV